jgi:hypothetical protein
MTYFCQPMLQVLREALRTLQTDPGPMTPERAEVVSYLRERIAAFSPALELDDRAQMKRNRRGTDSGALAAISF